jgi:cell shape-determining protein MreC
VLTATNEEQKAKIEDYNPSLTEAQKLERINELLASVFFRHLKFLHCVL